jgi:hypothetical protein
MSNDPVGISPWGGACLALKQLNLTVQYAFQFILVVITGDDDHDPNEKNPNQTDLQHLDHPDETSGDQLLANSKGGAHLTQASRSL